MRRLGGPALVAAVAFVVVAALLLPARTVPLHGVGWVACLLAFSLVAIQRRSAAQRRSKEYVVEARTVRWTAIATMASGALVITAHAGFVAWDLASRWAS